MQWVEEAGWGRGGAEQWQGWGGKDSGWVRRDVAGEERSRGRVGASALGVWGGDGQRRSGAGAGGVRAVGGGGGTVQGRRGARALGGGGKGQQLRELRCAGQGNWGEGNQTSSVLVSSVNTLGCAVWSRLDDVIHALARAFTVIMPHPIHNVHTSTHTCRSPWSRSWWTS